MPCPVPRIARLLPLLALGLLAAVCAPAHAEVGDTWEEVSGTPFAGRQGYHLVSFQGKLYGGGGTRVECECPGLPESEPCFQCRTVSYPDIWVSDDGVTWERLLAESPARGLTTVYMFAFKDKLYIKGGPVQEDSPPAYSSPDGVTWAPMTSSPLALYGPPVEWKGRVLLPGTSLYTEDGQNWEESLEYEFQSGFYPTAAAALGDYLYAFQSQRVWRSTTGFDWEELEGNTDSLVVGDGGVAMASFAGHLWLGGDFYYGIGGQENEGAIWKSANGANWTRIQLGSTFRARSPVLASFRNYLYLTDTPKDIVRTTATCPEYLGRAYSSDAGACGVLELGELLRAIQLFSLEFYTCDETTEDGYTAAAGRRSVAKGADDGEGVVEGEGAIDGECVPHTADVSPQDWTISLPELLRVVQLYNAGSYHPCPNPEDSEDGFCVL